MAAWEAGVRVAVHYGALPLHRPFGRFEYDSGVIFVYNASQLGGLHSNGYISDLFSKAFATEGMKAYVEIIQRRERELGTDMLTHQKVRTSEPMSFVKKGR